ncbi:hypothetical protein J2T07_001101 [Luteibacter jiangsuensis]|uniref:Uncharacterized protein n=1 Tax=Luteibacter jiangsuensis TaxID=637577 RepID=A0ABT9SVA2_9GAMM|nr:hypothetical protein [Luteibacter jiangsuensis]
MNLWEPTLSAIPRQRARLRQAPIAAEAAPTRVAAPAMEESAAMNLWEPTLSAIPRAAGQVAASTHRR